MKRFIRKLILFILIGLSILSALNYRYENTNYYRGLNNTDKFFHVPEGVQVANLGTSHTMHGIGYEDFEYTGFNFALDAQRFYYDDKIIRQYSDKLTKGAVVLIPVSYFSFYLDQQGQSFMDTNPRYYRFLKPKYIKNFTLGEYFRFGVFAVLAAGRNIKYVVNDLEHITMHVNQQEKNLLSIEQMETNGLETAKRHLSFVDKWGDQEHENIRQLSNIIKYSQERGFRPVLITPPFTDYYNRNFPDEFFNRFYYNIQGLIDQYNIKYIDYSHDRRFDNIDLFFDASHLNLSGRKLFSAVLIEDMRIMKFLD